MRRLVVALVALLVAAGLQPAAEAASSPLVWKRCADDRSQWCGTLTVPLAHDDPSKGTITLGLRKRPHTGDTFRGTMVVHAGGPGAEGAAAMGWLPIDRLGPVADDYDWIGLDPRGVGTSRPRVSCLPNYGRTNRPGYATTTSAARKAWRARAEKYAAACGDTQAERRLLKRMRTLDTVADLESLREALGEPALNLYAFSYGTYVAQAYATEHPDRVGRFVLDGVVDPRRTWYDANRDQDAAFQVVMERFWGWVAARHGTYGLGTTAAEVESTYERLLRRAATKPFAGQLGPAEIADATLDAGYSVGWWRGVAGALSELADGDGWSLLYAYRAGLGTPEAERGYAAYLATECTDAPWPDLATMRADAESRAADLPFLTWSNTWYNAPCTAWPVPAGPRPTVDGAQVDDPVLLVSETLDGATPFSGAVEVRRRFTSSALVAGVGGTSHAVSMSAGSCVTDAVAAYLADGTLPIRRTDQDYDVACDPVQPRDDARSAARRALLGR